MKTKTKPSADQLQAAWEKARDHRNAAACRLAYDVTIRAEDRYVDERPDPALTERLKAEYRTAHTVERAAWESYQAAWT